MTKLGTPLQIGIEFDDDSKVFIYWTCNCGKNHTEGRTDFGSLAALEYIKIMALKLLEGRFEKGYVLNPAPSLGEITK